MKKRLFSLALALSLAITLVPTALAAEADAEDQVLLVQANDFDPTSDTNDGIYIAELTDQYFEGGVEAGMEALLEAGQVYLNGLAIPADAETFTMNGMPAIWQKEDGHWTWQAHDKLNADNEEKIPHNGDYSFEFARRRFVLAVSALRGMTTTITAENGAAYATRVDFVVKSAGQVEKIVVNSDGTTTVWGVPVDATSYNTDGGPNDVESRTIPTANFDPAIKEGDTVLYWEDAEGWHMERCVPVVGLMDAADHFNIKVNGVTYSDALIVRYNMQAGSRPSQFISAANNLELQNIPVTLWNTETGYVVGISRMDNAKEALTAAIAYCDELLADAEVIASDDGVGVPVGAYYASQANVDAFYANYANAKAVLDNPASTNAQMDAATQALGSKLSGKNGLVLKTSGDLIAEIDTQRVGGGAMGNAVGIYDYPEYFDEAGVFGVVEAGNFYINDFQVPASPEELAALGEEGFVVNSGATSLTAGDGAFLVDGKDKGSEYAAAIKSLINDELPGGLHMDLYDTDSDGKADVVKLWYTEGLIVNRISRDAAGNYILDRGGLERVPSHAGRLYDADNFGNILGETVKPENFDFSLKEGDGAVFYLTPDGWIVKKAVEANGIFVDGVDHDFYQIDATKYTDTMKYSRDNLIVAQRNGEFANAHTYFGFKNNDKGIKVSMWMDPYSMSPIGITSNENARVFLTDAIAQSKAKLASVTLTGTATAEQKFAYAALEEAVQLAEETLADPDSYNSELDFWVYYLYLAQAGTGSDIGAAFSGFFTNAEFGWERMNAYPGFDALFTAAEPAPSDDTYTVAAGDCLWNIAAKVYGSGAQFGRIAQANGIAAPYTIYVGQVLTIPAP